jgi:hypothetical protein
MVQARWDCPKKRREEIRSCTHENVDAVIARVLQVQPQLPLLRDESFEALSNRIASGRKAFNVCDAGGACPDEFHELRKRTKTLRPGGAARRGR